MKRLMVVLLLAGMAFCAPPKPMPGWATPQHRFSFLRTMFDTRTGGGGGGTSLPDVTDTAGVSVESTVPIIIPSGNSTANIAIHGNTTSGLGMDFSGSGPRLWSVAAGARRGWELDGNTLGLVLGGTFALGWTSNATDPGLAGADLIVRRRTTANIAMGTSDVNGVPVAQTISVQNAITGSNLVGSIFTLAGPLGTGTGLPSPVSIQGADQSVASGATAQTEIHRLVIGDTKNLTTGAATTVLSIPLATLQMAGGNIAFHMEATDGTNQCTRDGMTAFSAENSAGVFVTNVTDATGTLDSTACTAAKTLTLAWAVTGANPALVQVTPTLTGITATRFSINYTVMYGGNTQPTL